MKKETWEIELTLTNRDTMSHQILLGHQAIMDNYLVDSGATHLMGHSSEELTTRSLLPRLHDEEEE